MDGYSLTRDTASPPSCKWVPRQQPYDLHIYVCMHMYIHPSVMKEGLLDERECSSLCLRSEGENHTRTMSVQVERDGY